MKEFRDFPKGDKEIIDTAVKKNIVNEDDEKIFGKNSEKQKLAREDNDLPDPAEEIFREINPMGRFLGDVKNDLEVEVHVLKSEIEELKNNSLDRDQALIDLKLEELKKKNLWITKINYYLLGWDMEDIRNNHPSLN